MRGQQFSWYRFISAIVCVRVAVVSLLLASVWLHLTKEPPFTAVFWDQLYAGWAVKILTGLEWRDFLLSPLAESVIHVVTKTSTMLLVLGLVSALLASKKRPWLVWGLYASSVVLGFEAFCAFVDVSYQGPMLIEHALRVAAPWFLARMIVRGVSPSLQIGMLIAIALTFSGHGLYAMGLGVPVPANFIDMVMETLGWNQESAVIFLLIAGILDQVMVIGLWPAFSRQASLWYGVFWGGMTSLARLSSYVRFDVLFWMSLGAYFPEFLVRAPHYLIPLALILSYRESTGNHDQLVPSNNGEVV